MSSNLEPKWVKSFLDIPAELRIEVYRIVIADAIFGGRVSDFCRGLYLSCRQVNAETQHELIKILKGIKAEIESETDSAYSFRLNIPLLETAPRLNEMALDVHFPKLDRNLKEYPSMPMTRIISHLELLASLRLKNIAILFVEHPDDIAGTPSDLHVGSCMVDAWAKFVAEFAFSKVVNGGRLPQETPVDDQALKLWLWIYRTSSEHAQQYLNVSLTSA